MTVHRPQVLLISIGQVLRVLRFDRGCTANGQEEAASSYLISYVFMKIPDREK